MTANEIRKKFLDFFASKGHTIVASDSLVPKDDPTVLFTTAGMQQFKRQFLGHLDGYSRAASSQKCLRTDDLDKVGKTPYHHTFFEMLGNFSFGDYFKEEAIAWAWEFLTQEMKLPAEKLWVSVYKDDFEAAEIWLKKIKIPQERLVRLGDKSNFWPSNAKEDGPNGPCGPCSEIFYDYGVNPDCPKGTQCDPDCSCGRFSEVWNLVFTQFNRKDGGVLEPLPSKNIDTGMGLERLVAVVQGKKNNYETDLFEPILAEIMKLGAKISQTESRIIADHIRAIIFAISDGVMPSNTDRGYIVKKLIIHITDIAMVATKKEKPQIYQFVNKAIKTMQFAYPELASKAASIEKIIYNVEESYIRVKNQKLPELLKEIEYIKNDPIVVGIKRERYGELIFKYRDTYGLTISTILIAFQSLGSEPDFIAAMPKYHDLMIKQQQQSRLSSKMTGDVFADAELDLNVPKTDFVGYKENQSEGRILKIFISNTEASEARKGDKIKIVLDKTPFYAESGGQIGDTGTITKPGARINVEDTQKIADVFIHTGTVTEGSFKINDAITGSIDADRRVAIMRNHTATHLLQAALRKVLGAHVQQQGSLVAEDRLRFDFTHPQAISKEQVAKIRDIINNWVTAGDPVQTKVMSIEEAKKSGALAFFAEKYGQTVRVVSIGDYSKEFCGGTHLSNTKIIERFEITKEGSVAQGIRRLEAKTGKSAEEFLEQQAQEEESQRKALALKESEAKAQKSQLQKIKEDILNEIEKNKQTPAPAYFTYTINGVDADFTVLRETTDFIKQKLGPAAIVLGSQAQGRGYVLASVPDSLTPQVDANAIIQKINPLIDGKGGGRPQMAQAGTKDPSKIDGALKTIQKYLQEKLGNHKS